MSRIRPCRPMYISNVRLYNGTRTFSSTHCVHKEADIENENAHPDNILATEGREDKDRDVKSKIKYENWIVADGQKWRYPDPLGPKWLGIDVPFPLNPTFRPPTPVSDALRTQIYRAFVTNPQQNDLRPLSMSYGVSMQRIEAIIRLKELEELWKKSKPLQTGFLKGMERLLGLNPGGHMTPVAEEVKSLSRRDAAASDEVSRQVIEQGQGKKRGISRTFFESVYEGEEPVIPRLLDEQRLQARASRAQRTVSSSKVVQPDPTKPAYRFIDVGLRWVDRADLERRAKESIRRKVIKSARKKIAKSDQDEVVVD